MAAICFVIYIIVTTLACTYMMKVVCVRFIFPLTPLLIDAVNFKDTNILILIRSDEDDYVIA